MAIELNLVMSLLGVLFSGFAAYVAVRVAQAETRVQLKSVEDDLEEIKERLKRIEDPYFRKQGRD